MNKKSQVWISAVLYILIAAISVVLILNTGLPLLEGMRDKAAFTRTKDSMSQLDRSILEVAGEGEGSQRIVPIEIKKGELSVENGKVSWQLTTKSKIIEPRSKITHGNLVISSNIDVDAHEYGSHYIIENSYISVNIAKFKGNISTTEDIINSITFKETNAVINGSFSFMVGNDTSTKEGNMTTTLIPSGNNIGLDFASVLVDVKTDSIDYTLELLLESQADFITARIKELN